MILSYPAKIKYFKEDKSYLVEFPDLPGCLTEGTSLDDAKSNAKEALTGYLASSFEREHKIPDPSKIKGRNVYFIEPEPAYRKHDGYEQCYQYCCYCLTACCHVESPILYYFQNLLISLQLPHKSESPYRISKV